jgi:hypothetical protein
LRAYVRTHHSARAAIRVLATVNALAAIDGHRNNRVMPDSFNCLYILDETRALFVFTSKQYVRLSKVDP